MSRVVILGAGHAGVTLAATLAQRGFAGEVTVVSAESGPPTQRPPLSKGYLLGETDAASIVLKPLSWFEDHGITLLAGTLVSAIDRASRTLVTGTSKIPYDRLVIATGVYNRRLGIRGEDLDGVLSLRTLGQADCLAQRLKPAKHVAIIGAGFIGLEFASVARRLGKQVTVLEAGPFALARSISLPMSAFLLARHRSEGVTIRFNSRCVGIEQAGSARRLLLADGETIDADLVLIAVGVAPADDLALAAGLATDDGIVVDETLATSDPAIYAIGDCARFPHADGRRLRLESVQNAVDQARIVAARLMGEDSRLGAVPWFWSDQFDMKLTIAGVAQPDDTCVVRDPGGGRFSVARLREGRLVALETVNLPGDHMAARRVIADRPMLDPVALAHPDIPFKTAATAVVA